MERKEVLLCNMQNEVDENLVSSNKLKTKWQAVPYSSDEIDGVMLHANRFMTVPDLTIEPKLSGYYDIHVGMYISGQFSCNKYHAAYIKLTSDTCFTSVSPCARYGNHKIDEFHWRAVDMTNQTITIRHPQTIKGEAHDTSIAFIRFVPLTDEEYKERKAEFASEETRKLFATCDMHCVMFLHNPQKKEDWLLAVEEYAESDVESLALENIRIFDGILDGDVENHAFLRPGDQHVYEGMRKYILSEDNVYPMMIEHGHKMGLKMYISMRMGAWGIEFPMDGDYFDNRFYLEHPELRCYDRDGTWINRLSYVYPEVRAYIMKQFYDMLEYGCDGISLIYTRGTPYVLFEQPILDAFAAEYPGVDCRKLPNTDERLIKVRAKVMTNFMRDMRKMLDDFKPGLKMNVHVHTSIKDNLYYALDIPQWVNEGLIDNIIVNNDYHWENLPDEVWEDETKTQIDLEKYAKWANSSTEIITCRNVYGHLIPEEAVREYNALTEGTNIRVFCDLQRDTPEDAKAEAIRLMDIGCKNICLWDTYEYKPIGRLWKILQRLGHRDQIRDFDINKYTKMHRVNLLSGMQVGRYCPWWGG